MNFISHECNNINDFLIEINFIEYSKWKPIAGGLGLADILDTRFEI